MKKSTFLGFFMGVLSLTTMNAQFIQNSTARPGSRNANVEQQKPAASVEELVARYNSLGSQSGSISEFFSKQEQRVLQAYFSNNGASKSPAAQLLSEGFDDITTLDAAGYSFVNASDIPGTDWFQGNPDVFPAHLGAADSYIGANYQNTDGSIINNFMITPVLNLENGDEITFITRTTEGSIFPDRLEVRISPDGANIDPSGPADVGSYTELLLEINPDLEEGGYPEEWTRYTAVVSGLTGAVDTRVAFRYYVTDGGPVGNNSNYIGVDQLSIDEPFVPTMDIAYGVNNSNQDLIGFNITDPENTEVFGTSPVSVNFENAGAIDPANPTTGYVLDNGGEFYSFDVNTGVYTSLGNIPGDWVGMEFDQNSGTLYGIAGTDLYTIDPAGLSATLVGSLGLAAGDLPIALAIDGDGVGYTYELVADVLYSVDLATGAATLVGPIGFDANYGQGMGYDSVTDTVYMSAFNGTTLAAEWRSVDTATGSTTLIGPIVTSEAITQVAWVSVGETLPPAACPEPTNLAVSNITETSADLAWDEEPNATVGYIWYVFEEGADPTTDTPVETGTTSAGTTTASATGLTNAMHYDFYVVADCDFDGLSTYAGPVNFATLITPPACGGKFYDTGGPQGDYENNENVTTVITPDASGDRVMVTFTFFDVESSWDALYVYDGPDTSSPLIDSGNPATNSGFPAGGYYGTTIPGPFTATNESGALTFVFMSDSSVPHAGWEADVTCFTPPPANDMIVNSIDVDEVGFPYTDPAVAMQVATTEDGNPAGCDLTGANGVWYNFVSEGDGTATATIETPSGASSVTFYFAPDEDSVETDLTLVPQQPNQCGPGTTASINTVAGQAYYVFVLNTGGITDITIDGTNLGVGNNTIEGFSYYPNPSSDIINLRAANNIEAVTVYNLLGQVMITDSVNAATSQINVSALSTGTYIMKVAVDGQIGTYKIIKN